jgi:hypothetical protein
VFIRHIFLTKPLVALAILVCMGTILALFKLNRKRPQSRSDKFLIAFVGLLTIYEAGKILKDSGVVVLSMNSFLNDAIELMVAMTCLLAAIMLQISRVDHLEAESAMRLVRAAPPRAARPDLVAGTTLDTLSWAVPRLSDGAFKLLAVLCLRSDGSTGRVPVGVTDVQLKLGKSKDDVDKYLKELQESGVVALSQQGATLDIEIVSPARRQATDQLTRPAALATQSQT